MRYASFVIRLWLPDVLDDSQPLEVRGNIEHVQSGRIVPITNPDKISPVMLEILTATLRTEETNDMMK